MTDESATDWLVSTLASDAMEGAGVLPLAIRPLVREWRVAGRVSVVTITRDDNLDLREAIASDPQPGTVLMVAGGAESTRACMGGLLARESVLHGFTAVITDAPVRDAVEIRASGLMVWSRGQTPIAPFKRGGGRIGGEVRFGEVTVRAGDYVVADEDGIVVWPWERYDDLLARARELLERDEERARELDARMAARG